MRVLSACTRVHCHRTWHACASLRLDECEPTVAPALDFLHYSPPPLASRKRAIAPVPRLPLRLSPDGQLFPRLLRTAKRARGDAPAAEMTQRAWIPTLAPNLAEVSFARRGKCLPNCCGCTPQISPCPRAVLNRRQRYLDLEFAQESSGEEAKVIAVGLGCAQTRGICVMGVWCNP
jgi:hypothetical protein